ncbi:MAG: hypothetical protein ABH845_02745 [Candidatus Omnitrophota bacterium]
MAEGTQPGKWHYSFWGVLVLLGLLGPLGLYFLWRSPSFGKVSKWLWTIAILVLTLLLIATAELLPLVLSQNLIGF